jgi:hypothetical protein
MSERDLNRAVAQATGEFVETIQKLGFGLIAGDDHEDPGPLVLDWDDHQPAYLGENPVPGRLAGPCGAVAVVRRRV